MNGMEGVSGPVLDFCLLVTQRRHRDDLRLVARGPDADRWLSFAQAYAGPPGRGRAPGQFAPAAAGLTAEADASTSRMIRNFRMHSIRGPLAQVF
jgi:hypothetical protein